MIAMILMIVLSLLAAVTLRDATSTEKVSSNIRQMQLAQQAAESALRYCEDAVVDMVGSGTGAYSFSTPASSTPSALSATMILDNPAGTPLSLTASNWDTSTTNAYPLILPLGVVNPSGVNAIYARPPECIVERLSPSTASTYNSNFAVTARGFGPDVNAADSGRSRPKGSEVWMQSTIELN